MNSNLAYIRDLSSDRRFTGRGKQHSLQLGNWIVEINKAAIEMRFSSHQRLCLRTRGLDRASESC